MKPNTFNYNSFTDLEQDLILAKAEIEQLKNENQRLKLQIEHIPSEVTEICPHCENEITVIWTESGYKTFCPVCGKRLMLCSACHDDGFNCNYDPNTDTCMHNKADR